MVVPLRDVSTCWVDEAYPTVPPTWNRHSAGHSRIGAEQTSSTGFQCPPRRGYLTARGGPTGSTDDLATRPPCAASPGRLAAGGWPLAGPPSRSTATDDDTSGPRVARWGRIVAWLRGGIPAAFPDHDYILLLALPRAPTDPGDEVKKVSQAAVGTTASPAGTGGHRGRDPPTSPTSSPLRGGPACECGPAGWAWLAA